MNFVRSTFMSQLSPAEARYLRAYSRGYRKAGDSPSDLLGAFSGDWFDRSGGYGGGCCCGGGSYSSGGLFSDGTLFALLAAAGLAFYILYTAVTAAAAAFPT